MRKRRFSPAVTPLEARLALTAEGPVLIDPTLSPVYGAPGMPKWFVYPGDGSGGTVILPGSLNPPNPVGDFPPPVPGLV